MHFSWHVAATNQLATSRPPAPRATLEGTAHRSDGECAGCSRSESRALTFNRLVGGPRTE